MNGGDMGLDQTLYWIGDPTESQVGRLRHRNLSNTNCSTGLSYISEEDYHDERYKYIRSYMIPEEVYVTKCDWKLMKADCGMPEDARICSLGPTHIKFGEAVNVGEVIEFRIDTLDERYWRPVLCKQYFYLCDEVYRWRNNYEIQELFDATFPDEWCEYKKKYEMLNCGYYPIADILDKMKSIDPQFANCYNEESDNIFYESNW